MIREVYYIETDNGYNTGGGTGCILPGGAGEGSGFYSPGGGGAPMIIVKI